MSQNRRISFTRKKAQHSVFLFRFRSPRFTLINSRPRAHNSSGKSIFFLYHRMRWRRRSFARMLKFLLDGAGEHACNRCQTTIDYVDAMSCATEWVKAVFGCRENPVACTIDFHAMIVQQPQPSIYSFGSFKHPGCSHFFSSFWRTE